MKIIHKAVAGTMESSDAMVNICPTDKPGIHIKLTSNVEKQFGEHIRCMIAEHLKELGVEDAEVIVVDKGALDCVIKARVYTAVHRACEADTYCWEGQK